MGASLAKMLREQGGRCALCNGALDIADANTDHRLPRSRGGRDVDSNKQATHRDCNTAKGNALIPGGLQ